MFKWFIFFLIVLTHFLIGLIPQEDLLQERKYYTSKKMLRESLPNGHSDVLPGRCFNEGVICIFDNQHNRVYTNREVNDYGYY